MKKWRSKYDRITKVEIDRYLADNEMGSINDIFLVEGMLCTIGDQIIYYLVIEDDNMYLAIADFLLRENINVFDSIKEVEKQLNIEFINN